MSFEQGLLAALGAVTSALIYLYQDIRKRSQICEEWRNKQEPIIRDLSAKVGALNSAMSFVRQCKTNGCIFTGMDGETFSIKRIQHPEEP